MARWHIFFPITKTLRISPFAFISLKLYWLNNFEGGFNWILIFEPSGSSAVSLIRILALEKCRDTKTPHFCLFSLSQDTHTRTLSFNKYFRYTLVHSALAISIRSEHTWAASWSHLSFPSLFFFFRFELHHVAHFTCFKSTFLLISNSSPERVEVTKNLTGVLFFFFALLLITLVTRLQSELGLDWSVTCYRKWKKAGENSLLFLGSLQERMNNKWLSKANSHMSTVFFLTLTLTNPN